MCNSSWAIALVNTMSDNVCISKGDDFSLSAQEILDCVDASYASCDGFNNGTVTPISDAFTFAQKTGVTALSCYPYTSIFSGQTNSKCASFCTNGSRIVVDYQIDTVLPLSGVLAIQTFLIINGGTVYFAFDRKDKSISFQF
jgi:hypothetical protein